MAATLGEFRYTTINEADGVTFINLHFINGGVATQLSKGMSPEEVKLALQALILRIQRWP